MAVQERLYTAQDLAAMPDNGKRHELIHGVMIEVFRPKFVHGKLAVRLARFIGNFVEERDLGEVTVESGYLLFRNPDTVRGPDVAFISKERLAASKNLPYPLSPELVIEIVSPNDTADEVNTKVNEYLKAGTKLVLVIYPAEKNAHAFREGNSAQIIDLDGTLDGGDVLPGFSLPLRDVFKGLEE